MQVPGFTGRIITTSIAIALLAGCSSQSKRAHNTEVPEKQAVANAHRSDPFAFPQTYDSFTHPASVSAAGVPSGTGVPSISIYGELPNTSAPSQAPATAIDQTLNVRQVTFAPEGSDFDPAPANDGSRLFFASTRHRPTADIYIQTVGGTAVTQLTSDPAHDVMPAVSPDSERVAFASNRNGTWGIYVTSAEGGQAIQLTSGNDHELHPSWSPDGTMITYCKLAESSNRWEIWVTDTTKPASHTFLTYGLFPQWHPNQNKILFQRSRDRGDRFFSLWTIDYFNGEAVSPTEVISSSLAAIINPSWSPDGRFIACATVFRPDANAVTADSGPIFADIWVLSADGRARTNLTTGWQFNSMPAWGPKGEIFYVSDRTGPATIWSLNPGQAIKVADFGNPVQDPGMAGAFSPSNED